MTKLRFLWILLCLVAIGCGPRPLLTGPAVPVPDNPKAYLAEVLDKAGRVSNVSGFAKLRIATQDKSAQSRNIFFVKYPDRIRIETLGFLSRPALLFTADRERMNLYSLADNAFFTGEPTAENFWRIIGMRLELPQIVEAFIGRPQSRLCDDGAVKASAREDMLVLTRECPELGEQFVIEPKAGELRTYTVYESGRPAYSYSYAQYQAEQGILFPLKIDIYHYTYKIAVILEFESLGFDTIPDERFILVPPAGAQVHSLEDLETPR